MNYNTIFVIGSRDNLEKYIQQQNIGDQESLADFYYQTQHHFDPDLHPHLHFIIEVNTNNNTFETITEIDPEDVLNQEENHIYGLPNVIYLNNYQNIYNGGYKSGFMEIHKNISKYTLKPGHKRKKRSTTKKRLKKLTTKKRLKKLTTKKRLKKLTTKKV
jgi:hypothetical protein